MEDFGGSGRSSPFKSPAKSPIGSPRKLSLADEALGSSHQGHRMNREKASGKSVWEQLESSSPKRNPHTLLASGGHLHSRQSELLQLSLEEAAAASAAGGTGGTDEEEGTAGDPPAPAPQGISVPVQPRKRRQAGAGQDQAAGGGGDLVG